MVYVFMTAKSIDKYHNIQKTIILRILFSNCSIFVYKIKIIFSSIFKYNI